jgi:Na+/melibiose symporter-like transporter
MVNQAKFMAQGTCLSGSGIRVMELCMFSGSQIISRTKYMYSYVRTVVHRLRSRHQQVYCIVEANQVLLDAFIPKLTDSRHDTNFLRIGVVATLFSRVPSYSLPRQITVLPMG